MDMDVNILASDELLEFYYVQNFGAKVLANFLQFFYYDKKINTI